MVCYYGTVHATTTTPRASDDLYKPIVFALLFFLKIERVKELYRELELEDVYAKYEEKTHKEIKELIAKVEDIPHAVRRRYDSSIFFSIFVFGVLSRAGSEEKRDLGGYYLCACSHGSR